MKPETFLPSSANRIAQAPAVSVVIPLYNKSPTVCRTLDSVLAQSVSDFEVIVVNDGSTDNGPDVVSAILDPRIRLIHQSNSGVCAARNQGIAASRNDLIALLDADDEWIPDHLASLLALKSRHPECQVLGCRYFLGNPEGQKRPATIRGLPESWTGILQDYFAIASTSDPPLFTSSIAFSRQAILSVGGFPEGIAAGEDLLTWARLAVRYPIAYAMKPTAIFWRDSAGTYDAAPSRVPPVPDAVGAGLSSLLGECKPSQVASLRKYIALWHKMRASMFMRLGCRKDGYRETLASLKCNSLQWKLYAYLFLNLLPVPAQRRIFKSFSQGRSAAHARA